MQSISLQLIQYPRILLSVVTCSSPSECNLGNITTDSCYSKSSCGCEMISWKVDVIRVDQVRVDFVTVDLMCTPLRFWQPQMPREGLVSGVNMKRFLSMVQLWCGSNEHLMAVECQVFDHQDGRQIYSACMQACQLQSKINSDVYCIYIQQLMLVSKLKPRSSPALVCK